MAVSVAPVATNPPNGPAAGADLFVRSFRSYVGSY